MNTKTLTSHNGPLLQITLTRWEVTVLQSMVELAAIPPVTHRVNIKHDGFDDTCYASDQSIGLVMRDFHKALDKLSTK